MEFANWFARELHERGLTQEAAARLIGPSRNTIHSWVMGTSKPAYRQLLQLVGAFRTIPPDIIQAAEGPAPNEHRRSTDRVDIWGSGWPRVPSMYGSDPDPERQPTESQPRSIDPYSPHRSLPTDAGPGDDTEPHLSFEGR